ncbi:hypothetical protein GPECTOR_5g128 [Gonium pectorale]|uniref:ABM domain-containing protein n=1 Tax=Gonium pectorale TaxID=33097 RepID=A0A150GVV9_GONPE|nr:hypothetical protein GPECTOR_5g128 [Gonium pectorale]|eukprot:KXZ54017.1 hypothetical protein GPECTOR_5g128 [Gonium pectorale]
MARPPTALLLAAAAALVLLGAASAARTGPSDPSSPAAWQRLQNGLRLKTSPNNVKALQWFQDRHGDGGDERDRPVYVAVKYEVPPSLHDEFIDKWLRLDKSLGRADGLDFYQLTKTANDNTEFWSYTEWDSFDDLVDFSESRDRQDFQDFVDDSDVLVEAFPLEPAGDLKREYRADREGEKVAAAARAAHARDLERRRRRREGDETEDEDPRETSAHVAVQFHVPPSVRDDFEDTFEDVQERVVQDENDNRFYVLRRFATLNHHYVLRGGWDSLDAYLDHVTSKTFRGLREFADKNDIEWHAEPFRVLASSEDGDE